MSRKTILHIESGRNLYGGALQVIYLLTGLARQEDSLRHILVCTKNSPFAQYAKENGIECEPITMKGDLDFLMSKRIGTLIKKHRPKLIHLHSRRGADIFGGIAGKIFGIPVLLTRRVDNPETRLLVKIKYQLYQHIICISEGIRQVLIKEGIDPNKTSTVHSAVDSQLYQMSPDKTWFHTEFGLPNNSLCIAVVAQLIERKGHKYLLSIIDSLVAQFPQLQLLIFGKGPLEGQIRQIIDGLKFKNNVHYLGFRDDMHRILPCLDILIHPATMEGLGVSLLQAAACGIPIVSSPVGGIPEIVKHEINGILLDPRDTSLLAQKIGGLLEQPEQRKIYGQAGRHLIEAEFSISSMVKGNLSIYRKFIECHS